MRKLCLLLALTLPMQAQPKPKPFSQSWNYNTTGDWMARDSIQAGAIVSVFMNIYTTQSHQYKYPQLVAVLLTMAASLLYEVSRWAEGKQPLALNSVYAGMGAVPVSFCFKIRF